MPIRQIMSALGLSLTLILAAFATTAQAEIQISTATDGQRMKASQITATITSIDREGLTVTLEGPLGQNLTLAADQIERLDEFQVGDYVKASFVESLSGELREPTEEEKKVPWVELDAGAIADKSIAPGAARGKAIRALCTIEGMNRVTQTVTVRDPKGNYHLIGDVKPEKMAGVTLGETIILTYTRAMALSLEKQ